MHKVVLQRNGCVDAVLIDGKEIAYDDGINTNELLYRMSKILGFEYESIDGDWDKNGNFVKGKRRK